MHEQLVAPRPVSTRPWWLSPPALLAWWAIAGAALGFGLGEPPVQRTQEARVLETARQMLGTGWRGGIGPMLNGQPRLRKPPLAYWMSAAAYEIAGVGEGQGRVPTALLGWLTLGVTFACARGLFGPRAAFFAAACLLCSYLFFRFSRLAETDMPATFFVTTAVFAFWRGLGGSGFRVEGSDNEGRTEFARNSEARLLNPSIWFHIGAAATALAILSKGPPGAYPPLFLLAMVALRRKWKALNAFFTSGAIVTLVVIAAPWFIYVFHTFGFNQWRRELDDLSGQDHPGPFYLYFYELFRASAPWCLVLPVALVEAILASLWAFLGFRWYSLLPARIVDTLRRRYDDPVPSFLTWLAVIFVPLCVVPNKQFHYLLPMMPPTMILIGWWIDLSLRKLTPGQAPPPPVVDATLIASAIAIPAPLVRARLILGRISPADWRLSAGIALALLGVGWVRCRHGRQAGLLAYLVGVTAVLVVTVSFWTPKFEGEDSRALARQVAASFGRGPFCFYGRNISLPLCFNLRVAIPQEKTAGELEQLVRSEPNVVVIVKAQPSSPAPPLPPGYVEQRSITAARQTFVFYRHSSGIIAGPQKGG